MRVGFTGTQIGMSQRQQQALIAFLRHNEINEFHHGDCIGADYQAHVVAVHFKIPVVIHPPSIETKRAWCEEVTILEPKPYLDRNHDIVDACDALIAAPSSDDEELRSGTWATVRYARKRRLPIVFLKR